MATELERLFVKFEGRVTDLEKAMKKVESTTRGTARSVERDMNRSFKRVEQHATAVTKKLGGLMGGLLAGIGGLAGGRALKGTLSELSNIGKQADTIGLTTDALQQLRFQGELAGVGVQETDKALLQLTKRFGEALLGGGEFLKITQQYGIALRDNQGKVRSQVDVLADLADALSSVSTEAEKGAISNAAFGRSGLQFGALVLGKGRAAFLAAAEEFRKTGGPISEEDIRLAEELDDKLLTLTTTLDRFSQRAQLFVLGGVSGIESFLADLSRQNRLAFEDDPLEIALIDPAVAKAQLSALRDELAETEVSIASLREVLAKTSDVPALAFDTEQIREQLRLFDAAQDATIEKITAFENALLLLDLKSFAEQAKAAAIELSGVQAQIATGALPPTAADEPLAKLNALRDVLALLEDEAVASGAGMEAAFKQVTASILEMIGAAKGGIDVPTINVSRPDSPVVDPSGGVLAGANVTAALEAGFASVTTAVGDSAITITKPLGQIVDASKAGADASKATTDAVDGVAPETVGGLTSPILAVDRSINMMSSRIANAISGLGASILRGSAFGGKSADISGIDLDRIQATGTSAAADFQRAVIDLMRAEAAAAEARKRADDARAQREADRQSLQDEIDFQRNLLAGIQQFGDAFPSATPTQLAMLGAGENIDLVMELIRLQEETNRLLNIGNDRDTIGAGGLTAPLEPITRREAELISFGRSAELGFGSRDTSRAVNDNRTYQVTQNFDGSPTAQDGRYIADVLIAGIDDQQARDLGSRLDRAG